ncbi:MAG: porin [Georgfuchsia sp.]
MQMKLIALAIAGLASTAALAESNVTIYGIMDASIDLTDTGDSATTSGQQVTKISSNQSRIGYKGSEDLGDGLSAIFQIETAINADGGTTSSLNSRNTFVGLTDKTWGRFIMGQHDSPYKTNRIDYFGDHLGDHRNLMGLGTASFDSRPSNTIRYDSPDMAGLKIALEWAAAAEGATTSGASKAAFFAGSGIYTITDEWDVRAAYQRHKYSTATGSTFLAASGITDGQAQRAWKLGTKYKSGPFSVGFEYEDISDDFAAAATKEHKAWTLGGSYKVGNNDFKLAYTVRDDIKGVADSGAKQIAVGVDHIMSKRTKLYAEYVKLTNDSAADFSLTGAGGNTTGGTKPLAAGGDPSAWQFGMKHVF